MSEPYDDMIHLPHHVSRTRPQMSMVNRAAQFSPFAALTGYDEAIQETGRLTDAQIVLDEDAKAAIDMKLRVLADAISTRPAIAVTYYRPDAKKDGGAYVYVIGMVKKIDEVEKMILLTHGEKIAIEDVIGIECELFKGME